MRPDEKRPLLLAHPLLRGVDPQAPDAVLETIPVKQVRAGALLNTPGVSDRLLHLVLTGRLRAYQVTADGRELLLELIEEGGFDGVLSVAGRRGHFTAADADSTVASLNPRTLERLVSSSRSPRTVDPATKVSKPKAERGSAHQLLASAGSRLATIAEATASHTYWIAATATSNNEATCIP